MTRGRHSERLHINLAPVAQAGAFYWAVPLIVGHFVTGRKPFPSCSPKRRTHEKLTYPA